MTTRGAVERDRVEDFYARKWSGTASWWQDRYPADQRVYATSVYLARNREILRAVGSHAGDVLDVGCGVGDVLRLLAPGANSLTGLDLSLVNLEGASRNLAEESIECNLVQSDAGRMPFGDGSFDTVIVADVIEHVASPRHTLKEIHRVLRPGGRMICVTPVRGVIHTLRFLDWIAASLARRGSSRLWWTNPQVYERFLSVREVEEAVRGAGFADRAHRRICFYPAPENHGTFGAFMHRLADRIGPGGFDRIADGWIRVFDLAARLGLANQKQLWEARK